VRFLAGAEFFMVTNMSRQTLRVDTFFCCMGAGSSFSAVKQPVLEADHPRSSAEVKYKWS
jgi:hypothetical protein